MFDLTDSQRSNLEKLANYLENLPTTYQHFEMDTFTNLETETELEYATKNGGLAKYKAAESYTYPCGTVACALGHGPAAGIIMTEGRGLRRNVGYGQLLYISWMDYGEQFTGESSLLDDFLFCGGWTRYDNTHRGAAARIRLVLAGNTVERLFEPNDYAEYVTHGDDHIQQKELAQ